MNRRSVLKQGIFSAAAVIAAKAGALRRHDPGSVFADRAFSTHDLRWQKAYDCAVHVLNQNVQVLPRFDGPVLIEGAEYAGIWQECGPHEALVYRRFRKDVARNSHLIFFALQRGDGQIPANHKRTETGFGQVQMVVPIAATAWELAQATKDEALLKTAYSACARWDAWLACYRNTRGTGLVEGFCTYDTGMDNSPRWAGMPVQCPDEDAKKCPRVKSLPRLCPDLSATIYGARVALAEMACALGKAADAEQWSESADRLRSLILSRLYDPEDAAFYDLDAENKFVKVRTCALARVCGEHVVDQTLFDELWKRQIHCPHAFWAAFPLPSVGLDDPLFVRPIPPNSWGGASQALTALRAGRWFDFYHRSAEFGTLMERWCTAIQQDMQFRQQMDPETGVFTAGGSAGYSPAALVMIDFTWRLAGIHEAGKEIHWNVRPACPASDRAHFRLRTDGEKEAEIFYDATGASLRIGGRSLARIDGGAVRLVTDEEGNAVRLTGISEVVANITLRIGNHRRRVRLQSNEDVQL